VPGDLAHYELHHEDETHLDTNPYLGGVWHRRGQQTLLPAAGTNRRLTDFGSVEVFGRGRVEVLCAEQGSTGFAHYLEALDGRHAATGREVFLALDHATCHDSDQSQAALAARSGWLHVIPLARYSPHLNRKERDCHAPCVSSPTRSWQAYGGSAANASTSLTSCPTGSSRVTAAHPPADLLDDQRAQRTHALAPPTTRTWRLLLRIQFRALLDWACCSRAVNTPKAAGSSARIGPLACQWRRRWAAASLAGMSARTAGLLARPVWRRRSRSQPALYVRRTSDPFGQASRTCQIEVLESAPIYSYASDAPHESGMPAIVELALPAVRIMHDAPIESLPVGASRFFGRIT
jgi:DDE superfamily endonuclease